MDRSTLKVACGHCLVRALVKQLTNYRVERAASDGILIDIANGLLQLLGSIAGQWRCSHLHVINYLRSSGLDTVEKGRQRRTHALLAAALLLPVLMTTNAFFATTATRQRRSTQIEHSRAPWIRGGNVRRRPREKMRARVKRP